MTAYPLRTYIYGSCVTRDMLELADPQEIEIIGYTARQSLISIGRNALVHWPAGYALTSRFQNRQARADWEGNAWAAIQEAAPTIDLLLLDLTDERFGIYSFNTQAKITRTADILNTPLEKACAPAQHLEFGSDHHYAWWTWAARIFIQNLKNTGLFHKTIVIKVPWAKTTETGSPIPVRVGLQPDDANQAYERYYRYLEQAGLRTIDLTGYPVFGEPYHQWGLAPYHYTLDVYQTMIEQLRGHITELYPDRATTPTPEEPTPAPSALRTVWFSAQEFLDSVDDPTGTHTITLGGHPTSIAFNRNPLTSQPSSIPLFFSGAIMDRANNQPPFFSGYGIARTLKTPMIAISDPLVDESPDTNIAWYTGSWGSGFQEELTQLLRGLITKYQKKLVLVGGSAGAYAALYYAMKTGPGASVLAWNPQTDITRYKEPFVTTYLSGAGAPKELTSTKPQNESTKAGEWQDAVHTWAADGTLDLRLPAITDLLATDQALIIQNKTDWHLTDHLQPWLSKAPAQQQIVNDSDAHILDPNHLILISDYAQGHATLPAETVAVLLEEILKDRGTILDIVE